MPSSTALSRTTARDPPFLIYRFIFRSEYTLVMPAVLLCLRFFERSARSAVVYESGTWMSLSDSGSVGSKCGKALVVILFLILVKLA